MKPKWLMRSARSAGANETLVFFHLPKTGGVTLKSIIRRQYPADQISELYRYESREAVRRFAELPLEERTRYRAVMGHMQLGIHQFIPGEHVYVTLLRDPVERCLSAYHFVLGKPNHARHDLVRGNDLEAVLQKGLLPFLDNGQTRALCSLDVSSVPYGGCTRDMLERAKDNLTEYIEFAGTIGHFDEMLLLLQDRLQWKLPLYTRRNRGVNRPPGDEISQETLQSILAHNQLDLELHDFVDRRFERRIAEQGEPFVRRLRHFRMANAVRSRFGREALQP